MKISPPGFHALAFSLRLFRTVPLQRWAILMLALMTSTRVYAVAFPGAQGYGAVATGGTTVYHITNLSNSGTGSFSDAISVSGRRVVFDVAGTITLTAELAISNNTTIDGTTAPSPGITITGQPVSFSNRSNVIIRNLRFREGIGGPSGKCSLQGSACNTIMIDHCSIEWGRWD